jgi:nucleoside-diphosphate-sugar epimerase
VPPPKGLQPTVAALGGGSGFVGSHVVLQLLNAGYTVRTTVRSLDKEQSVRLMLKNAGAKMANRSEIAVT